jgi:predicted AAA+ superfamily ATPase
VPYIERLADAQLADGLERAGAVLIEGPKACGKTATASRQAASILHVDSDPAVAAQVAVDPALALEGPKPRLLDEWQLQQSLWNAVRREVDDSGERGQFILAGSTAPAANAVRHSGAGRFARLRMRTMSLFESGESEGTVSLAALLEGDAPRSAGSRLDFDSLLARIARGGWPGQVGLPDRAALAGIRDYATTVATVDIDSAGKLRDPARVLRLMRALARSTSTEVTVSTLARDEASLSRDAVREYLDALSRIFIIEDQPAWSAHLRSSATLRQEPKRHFADPSLALALVGADAAGLRRDLAYAGQLFESFVVHELRVLAQPLDGEVFHARDSAGREVDAIVQLPSGQWAGFEVKLGTSPETVDRAADSLRAFTKNIEGAQDPVLTVVTGTGPSYRRADGVNVVAVSALAP